MKNMIMVTIAVMIAVILFSCGSKKTQKQFTTSKICEVVIGSPEITCSIADLAKKKNLQIDPILTEKILEENFSPKAGAIKIELLNFWNKPISFEQILAQINEFGYRPATIREIMCLNDNNILGYRIIALWSSFNFNYPNLYFENGPKGIEDGQKYLEARPENVDYSYDNKPLRFAAVRK